MTSGAGNRTIPTQSARQSPPLRGSTRLAGALSRLSARDDVGVRRWMDDVVACHLHRRCTVWRCQSPLSVRADHIDLRVVPWCTGDVRMARHQRKLSTSRERRRRRRPPGAAPRRPAKRRRAAVTSDQPTRTYPFSCKFTSVVRAQRSIWTSGLTCLGSIFLASSPWPQTRISTPACLSAWITAMFGLSRW
jgi:hypothetical protein